MKHRPRPPGCRGGWETRRADDRLRAKPFRYLSLGFKASRSQSPRTLTDRTRKTSAATGRSVIHHSPEKRKLLPTLIRVPSDGVVGGTPTPRKESVASEMI